MVTHISNVIAAVLKRSFLFYKILITAKRKNRFLQSYFIPPKKPIEKF